MASLSRGRAKASKNVVLSDPGISDAPATARRPVTRQLQELSSRRRSAAVRDARLLPVDRDMPVKWLANCLSELGGRDDVARLLKRDAVACAVRPVATAAPRLSAG